MRREEIVSDDGSTSVLTYNDAGLQVRATDYDAAGNMFFDIHYAFDESQRVTEWRVLDSSGNILRRFEVDYDDKGREFERLEYGMDDKLERREQNVYDNNNLLVEERHYDATGRLGSRKVYRRNKEGDIVSVAYYDSEDNEIPRPAV